MKTCYCSNDISIYNPISTLLEIRIYNKMYSLPLFCVARSHFIILSNVITVFVIIIQYEGTARSRVCTVLIGCYDYLSLGHGQKIVTGR